MIHVVIATDSQVVADEVRSVLPAADFEVEVLTEGREVTRRAKISPPDFAIVDFQIGSMGGMAVCLDLRLEASGGRLPEIPTLLLLDRRADVFLARRSQAHGWLIKPLDPIRLRKAVRAILDGERYEDGSYAPHPVCVN